MIYVITKSKTKDLVGNIAFIKNFSRSAELQSQGGYWLNKFESCVESIRENMLFFRARRQQKVHDVEGTAFRYKELGEESSQLSSKLIRTPSMIVPTHQRISKYGDRRSDTLREIHLTNIALKTKEQEKDESSIMSLKTKAEEIQTTFTTKENVVDLSTEEVGKLLEEYKKLAGLQQLLADSLINNN